jgi:hypothetical protein
LEIVDKLTDEVQVHWCAHRDLTGHWSDEEKSGDGPCPEDGFGNKAHAVKVAKREAVRRQLPFNSKTDCLDGVDIDEGDRVECLICRTWKRSKEAWVCDECRRLIRVGKTFEDEQEQVLVYVDKGNVVRTAMPDRDALINALLRLAGANQNFRRKDQEAALIEIDVPPAIRRLAFRGDFVSLGEEQARRLQQVYTLVNQAGHVAYDAGYAKGRDSLRGLMDAVKQFSEVMEGLDE